ncbi:MAG: phosphotransferase [Acidimicrobiia bacterium]|nr:phosphotransferase [Acidimicrobiia bacterium]
MHDDQIAVTAEQVTALVANQCPALAGLEVVPAEGAGTVNAVYRIGEEVTARFPLRRDEPAQVVERLRREMAASAEFALACPVAAPEPLELGRPGHGYPLPWMTQSWLPGSPASPTSWERSADLARDLADVVGHLRGWVRRGRQFRGSGRGGVLSDHDAWVDECIRRSEGLLDTDAMRTVWSRFRRLPREDPDAMCHGDLIPSNVLVDDGRLTGVLDTGGFQAADPALDLVAAWHLFDAGPRDQLRRDLDCSELQWERGKAWAFQQAAGAYWYYRQSNDAMADMGRTTLERLLRADG